VSRLKADDNSNHAGSDAETQSSMVDFAKPAD